MRSVADVAHGFTSAEVTTVVSWNQPVARLE